MQARLGAPKAITATAQKLARLISSMLKHGTASVRRGMNAYAQPYRDRVVKQMTRRAKALGYTLVKAPEGAAVSPPLPGAVPWKASLESSQRPEGRREVMSFEG